MSCRTRLGHLNSLGDDPVSFYPTIFPLTLEWQDNREGTGREASTEAHSLLKFRYVSEEQTTVSLNWEVESRLIRFKITVLNWSLLDSPGYKVTRKYESV